MLDISMELTVKNHECYVLIVCRSCIALQCVWNCLSTITIWWLCEYNFLNVLRMYYI